MTRPAVPIELKRRILVEAGHRCAIPTCRATTTEIAHITPWSEAKEHKYENLISLCPNCHTRFDKGEIDKKAMLMYKDNLRFFIDKFSKFELDVLLHLNNLQLNYGVPFVEYNFLLIKSLLDNEYVKLVDIGGVISVGGINSAPKILVITEKGKKFIIDLSTSDIGYNSIKS